MYHSPSPPPRRKKAVKKRVLASIDEVFAYFKAIRDPLLPPPSDNEGSNTESPTSRLGRSLRGTMFAYSRFSRVKDKKSASEKSNSSTDADEPPPPELMTKFCIQGKILDRVVTPNICNAAWEQAKPSNKEGLDISGFRTCLLIVSERKYGKGRFGYARLQTDVLNVLQNQPITSPRRWRDKRKRASLVSLEMNWNNNNNNNNHHQQQQLDGQQTDQGDEGDSEEGENEGNEEGTSNDDGSTPNEEDSAIKSKTTTKKVKSKKGSTTSRLASTKKGKKKSPKKKSDDESTLPPLMLPPKPTYDPFLPDPNPVFMSFFEKYATSGTLLTKEALFQMCCESQVMDRIMTPTIIEKIIFQVQPRTVTGLNFANFHSLLVLVAEKKHGRGGKSFAMLEDFLRLRVAPTQSMIEEAKKKKKKKSRKFTNSPSTTRLATKEGRKTK